MNNTTVPNDVIDLYDTAITAAALVMDDDEFESYTLSLDPDGRVYSASVARRFAREQARRDGLTDDERAAEDATIQRLVEEGLVTIRRILAGK